MTTRGERGYFHNFDNIFDDFRTRIINNFCKHFTDCYKIFNNSYRILNNFLDFLAIIANVSQRSSAKNLRNTYDLRV